MLSAERRTKSTIAAFVMLTITFLLVLISFSWILTDVQNSQESIEDLTKENHRLAQVNRLLIRENHLRISEIQDSRVESCKKTYTGISDVFRPFFPKEPLTDAQRERLEQFNTTIVGLKNGCNRQVHSVTKG